MPTHSEAKLHEELARLRKAVKLADAIDSVGFSPADLERMRDVHGWAQVATLAGVSLPSAATQALVSELLTSREAMREKAKGSKCSNG